MPKKRGYSPLESRLVEIFSSVKPGRRFTTTALMDHLYGGNSATARQSLMSVMRSLIRKADDNEEKWKIRRTEGMGPKPHEFWKETR
jgi:DNA-binding response OmpR family regulator